VHVSSQPTPTRGNPPGTPIRNPPHPAPQKGEGEEPTKLKKLAPKNPMHPAPQKGEGEESTKLKKLTPKAPNQPPLKCVISLF